ncbi:hypothetical protein EJ110_NYTH49319 [Nymphaea thermarum]|nr:hypothetical protein EJ110_NYTH49319 [Nymphaea thermarum]
MGALSCQKMSLSRYIKITRSMSALSCQMMNRGRSLTNFLIPCFIGTMFLKSIDGVDKNVIKEINEENVVQIETDNASNYVKVEKMMEE